MSRENTLALESIRDAAALADGESPCMDEQEFRAFYAKTARSLRAYIASSCGNADQVDDLLQETYFRLLRIRLPREMDAAHRRNYLFRVATNLVRDHFRRSKRHFEPLGELPVNERTTEKVQLREDMAGALRDLKPRQRELLWLAYVEGSKHTEIAESLGLKAQSIRPMLFRARRKLAALLRKKGLAPAGIEG